jgi:hypothetical protein
MELWDRLRILARAIAIIQRDTGVEMIIKVENGVIRAWPKSSE